MQNVEPERQSKRIALILATLGHPELDHKTLDAMRLSPREAYRYNQILEHTSDLAAQLVVDNLSSAVCCVSRAADGVSLLAQPLLKRSDIRILEKPLDMDRVRKTYRRKMDEGNNDQDQQLDSEKNEAKLLYWAIKQGVLKTRQNPHLTASGPVRNMKYVVLLCAKEKEARSIVLDHPQKFGAALGPLIAFRGCRNRAAGQGNKDNNIALYLETFEERVKGLNKCLGGGDDDESIVSDIESEDAIRGSPSNNNNNTNDAPDEEDPLDFKTTVVLDDKMKQQQQQQPRHNPDIDEDGGHESDEDYDDEKELKRTKKPSKSNNKKKKNAGSGGRKTQSARRPKKSTRARRPHVVVAPKKKTQPKFGLDSDNEDSGSSTSSSEEERYVPVKRIKLAVPQPLIDLSEQHSNSSSSEEDEKAMDVVVAPVMEPRKEARHDIVSPSLVTSSHLTASTNAVEATPMIVDDIKHEEQVVVVAPVVTNDIKQETVIMVSPQSTTTTTTNIKTELPPVVVPPTTAALPHKFTVQPLPFSFGGAGSGLDAIDSFIQRQQQRVSVSF